LLLLTGSVVDEVTTAVLVIVPPAAGTFPLIVITEEALAASAGVVQLTTPPDCKQLQPLPDALTKITPAGSVSLIETALADEGPLFVTVIV
jgi:hypothetical protein